jgi:exonuclease VII large subunit
MESTINERIDAHRDQIHALHTQLRMAQPQTPDSGSREGLLAIEKQLRNECERLTLMKQQRMRERDQLLHDDKHLCQILDTNPFYLCVVIFVTRVNTRALADATAKATRSSRLLAIWPICAHTLSKCAHCTNIG